MKAIRVHEFGGPEVLRLEEIEDPLPGPGQLLISVKAAGVNPVETYVRAGTYPSKPSLPFTPGSDAGGVVEVVGEGVRRFSVGDRVYTTGSITGAYAEKALIEESQAQPLPDRLTFAQGAAINIPYATAYRALVYCGRGVAGETILVHGATGGVGTAAVEIAKSLGFVVVGTGGTDEGLRLVKDLGADFVFNHREPDYLAKSLEATGGAGFDVILEMLANVNLDKDLSVLARYGRVVVIGNRGRVEIDPRHMMVRDSSIIGMTLPNASEKERRGIYAALNAGFANGALSPIIGREIPLANASEAHIAVMETGAKGKIVLVQ